jgi:hypothetical protein
MITEATMPNAAAVASIGHDTFKALTSECGMVLRIVETHPITSNACSGFAREEIKPAFLTKPTGHLAE